MSDAACAAKVVTTVGRENREDFQGSHGLFGSRVESDFRMSLLCGCAACFLKASAPVVCSWSSCNGQASLRPGDSARSSPSPPTLPLQHSSRPSVWQRPFDESHTSARRLKAIQNSLLQNGAKKTSSHWCSDSTAWRRVRRSVSKAAWGRGG